MVKDETLVTCVVSGTLGAIAIGAMVTGNDGGLVSTVIAALAAFTGVGLGRASKKNNKES